MVFQLDFESFMILNKRINNTEGFSTETIFPLFYYLSATDLYLYKPYNNFVFCTIIPLESIKDLKIFKMEHFPKAYGLAKNYISTIERELPKQILEPEETQGGE